MSASTKAMITYRGRYGWYHVTKKQMAKHLAFLKTPEGKRWLSDCAQADYEYKNTMSSFNGSIAE